MSLVIYYLKLAHENYYSMARPGKVNSSEKLIHAASFVEIMQKKVTLEKVEKNVLSTILS